MVLISYVKANKKQTTDCKNCPVIDPYCTESVWKLIKILQVELGGKISK